MTTFQCQGCGECCKHLTETKGGFTTGMLLTEKEKQLFGDADISPAYCVDDKIVLWQLNKAVCPLYVEGLGCGAYWHRPLVCRAFPIVNSAVSLSCGAADNMFAFSTERYEAEKLKRYMSYRMENAKEVLRYDLGTNQWRQA